MTTLIIGVAVAVAALAFVLWPLFAGRRPDGADGAPPVRRGDAGVEQMIRSARENLQVCAHCGDVIAGVNARYCPSCGAPVSAPRA